MIYRAREMSDVDARIALNRELEKEIAFDKALYLPIVSGKGEWVLSPRLKNFQLSWQGWAAGATRDLEQDSNLRPPGYEPGELPNCSTAVDRKSVV